MQVKTLMKISPATIDPAATLAEARELMALERVRELPVVRDVRLVGMLTDRDIRAAAVSTVPSLARYEYPLLLDRMAVADVMTHDIVTAGPETPVQEAARLLSGLGLSSLPIVEEGLLLGLVSARELLGVLAGGLDRERRLGFGHILIPIDGTRAGAEALAVGLALARRHGSEATLLHVLVPFGRYATAELVPTALLSELVTARRAGAWRLLSRETPSLDGLRVGFEAAEDDPVQGIVRVAARIDAQLIVMARHSRAPSVVEAVVRAAPCPVLVLNPGEEPTDARA
jgi:acetoin utilization protein AcuB